METKPGIPPTGAHIEAVVQKIKTTRPNGILTTTYYGRTETESLASRSGARAILLPGDVDFQHNESWITFMDRVLAALK